MRIGIIGAGGKAGSAIYREALRRGHDTTAIVRSRARARGVLGSDVAMLEKNGFELDQSDIEAFDVLVNAAGFIPPEAGKHVDLTKHLVSIAHSGRPRLVFILGAGSLYAGEDRHRFIEDIKLEEDSDQWIAIPAFQLEQLTLLEGVTDADWVGVSPQALFYDGHATTPVLGTDEIMKSSDGKSHTSTGTMAVAILDELENPSHSRTRFTVGDE